MFDLEETTGTIITLRIVINDDFGITYQSLTNALSRELADEIEQIEIVSEQSCRLVPDDETGGYTVEPIND